MKQTLTCLALAVALLMGLTLGTAATPAHAAPVTIDWVTVGNPGNANDIHGNGFGAVAYTYRISKFEITAGQYTEFLNAVAKDDPNGLYNSNIWSNDDSNVPVFVSGLTDEVSSIAAGSAHNLAIQNGAGKVSSGAVVINS